MPLYLDDLSTLCPLNVDSLAGNDGKTEAVYLRSVDIQPEVIMTNSDASAPSSGPEAHASRTYETEQIAVYWEPKLCFHSGNCVRALPAVFDPKRRPWIDVNAATADDIAAAVQRCPSGALRFERRDQASSEPTPARSTVTAQSDGPLVLQGNFTIVDQDSGQARDLTRVSLCRCGGSHNKPFCDGTHARIGFRSRAEQSDD